MPSHLKEVLDELHLELAGHPTIDVGTRESLRSIAAEITQLLNTKDSSLPAPTDIDNSSANASLSSRVQSLIDEFELQHPQLTKTLSTIAERLADMGI